MQNKVKKSYIAQHQSKNYKKPSFQWTKVSGILKSQQNSKPIKLLLHSTLGFELPVRQDNNIKKKLNHIIRVDLEKSLHYQNDVGWSWHKSSNLPNIAIKVQLRDQKSDQSYYPPQQTYVQVYSVKMIFDNSDKELKACLQDIGIKGNSLISLKNGCGVISGIRFLSTSYNNQGVKFYLLIVVYGNDPQTLNNSNKGFPNNIIASLLSPAIFVDSRKAARDYQGKKFFSFIQLFHAHQIQRPLVLKRPKIINTLKSRTASQMMIDQGQQGQYGQSGSLIQSLKIDNDLNGLYNYLTAPNIRNKVKHPIFLSIKFSSIFKIFYNTKYYYEDVKLNTQSNRKKQIVHYDRESLNLAQVLKIFQRKLIRDVGNQRKTKKGGDTNKKSFIIKILADNNSAQKVKICELLDFLNCKSILICDKDEKMADYFVDIIKLETGKNGRGQKFSLLEVYVNILQSLQKLTKQEIDLRTKNEAVQQQSQDGFQQEQVMKQVKREKLQRKKKYKERIPKLQQKYQKQKKIMNENKNYNRDSDDFFFDSSNYHRQSENQGERHYAQKDTYQPYAGNQNQVKKRIVDRNVEVKIVDPNNQPPLRINNKNNPDQQFLLDDQVFLNPLKDQQYKNVIEFNDINDYFDFNPPQKDKDNKPVTRKLMQQKIEDQQKTIQVLTKILQDKVIEQKVNASMAAAAINQATNLASQAILNNSLSNTLANNLNNTMSMNLNVVNPLTPLNSLNPIINPMNTMANIASMTPLTNLNTLNTLPHPLSQNMVQTVITPSGIQLKNNHFSMNNPHRFSKNNFKPNPSSHNSSNIQIINQNHVDNITGSLPQDNNSQNSSNHIGQLHNLNTQTFRNNKHSHLEIIENSNQESSQEKRAKVANISHSHNNRSTGPQGINNLINTNLLHRLQHSITNHQVSQAKRIQKEKEVIQLNQKIIEDKKEHQQQINRLKRQLKLQKSKNNNQNEKKQICLSNGLNLPDAPSYTIEVEGVKKNIRPQFSVKIQKINQQIHRIEIQNEVYRQKILNNELLIQNLKKQLLKQQQRLIQITNE